MSLIRPARAVLRTGALLLLCALSGCVGLQANPLAGLEPQKRVTDASIERGRMLLATGEYDLAYRTFIQHLRTGDRQAEAYSGAAVALEAQGFLYQARDLFERARDIAPGSATVHNNLGVVYFKLQEYELARQSFRTAFAVSSGENGVAAHNLSAAERAIAARQPETDPAITMALTREGRGAYVLSALEGVGPVGETIYTRSPLEGLPAPVETVTLAVATPEEAPESDRLIDQPPLAVADGPPAPSSTGDETVAKVFAPNLPDAASADLAAAAAAAAVAAEVPEAVETAPAQPETVARATAPASDASEPADPPMPSFQPAPAQASLGAPQSVRVPVSAQDAEEAGPEADRLLPASDELPSVEGGSTAPATDNAG